MKKVLTFLFLIFFFMANSQVIIKGKIIDENNLPVGSATLTIENISDDNIIGFSISDSNGDYKIEFEDNSKELILVITTVNYEKISVNIVNKNQTLNFTLKEHTNFLEEVKIGVKSIHQRGDTLSFITKSYEGKEDRTLSDVLKKIPGIEIEKNGLIKYQGNPINKFYVEGKDLMSGGYATLTNSLPKDAATRIEILENHQPLKILKNSVPSERAAINIKLKKNITLTGDANIGIGLSPFLWSSKITPMMFTKKYQYLINYKTNNIGENVVGELQTFSFDEGFEGLTFDNETGVLLNVSQSGLPKIDENRFLFNKTQLFSANILTTISKNWEFKANTNFYNDRIERNGAEFSKINFFNSDGTVKNSLEFNRINETKLNNNQSRSQIVLTKNTEKSFLKNTFTFKSNWSKTTGKSIINSNNINQNISSPGYSIQNSLSAIQLVGKKIINIKSIFNFINDKQDYEVNPFDNINLSQFPVVSTEKINQSITLNSLDFSNEASFIFVIEKFSIIPTLGLELERKTLKTSISGENPDKIKFDFGKNFNNNLTWQKFNPTSNFAINYVGESLNLTVNLPVKLNHLNAENSGNDFSKTLNKLTFEPNFKIKYKITSEFSKTFYGSITNSFGTINNTYPSFIFSELNLTSQNSDIQQSSTKKIGGNFEYKLILSNLFMNLNYKIAQVITNNTVSQNISENGQTVFEQLVSENKSNSKYLNFEVSKYFPKIKSKITLGYGLNENENNLILNSNNISVLSNGNSFNLKLNNNSFSWLTFDYSLIYDSYERANLNKTKSIKSYVKAFIFLSTNHSIGIYKDDYIYKFDKQNFNNQFLDLSYQYRLEKRKIDFELKWTNILNKKNYEELILNDIGFISNTYSIRPSQILASIKFNFN